MNPSTATTSAQALQNLQQFQSGVQTPGQELSSAQNNLGVSQAQQQVSGLRSAIQNSTNLLNQVAPSVQGRTQNSLVTSAQAGKQIANEEAPIDATLKQQTSDYNNANANYTNLEQRAEAQANANEQGQTNQLSYLQNIYNDLYGKEQATQAQQQAAAAEAERVRASGASNNTIGAEIASMLGGNSTGKASQPSMNQRSGGGFNFTDSNGNPISAAKYAQATGKPLGTLLQQMGNAGDKYSQQLYNELNNILSTGGSFDSKIKQEYAPIFWGT